MIVLVFLTLEVVDRFCDSVFCSNLCFNSCVSNHVTHGSVYYIYGTKSAAACATESATLWIKGEIAKSSRLKGAVALDGVENFHVTSVRNWFAVISEIQNIMLQKKKKANLPKYKVYV